MNDTVPAVSEEEVERGLRSLLYDGLCAQVMAVLTGGAFLVAFALMMGASNTVIGLIAAIPPITQVLQVPAIYLVNKTGKRRRLVVWTCLVGRLGWFVVAAVPWLAPPELRVPIMLGALLVYFGLGAVAGCSFNSWIRDLIPEDIMGTYFARRMAIATAVGAALSVAAGFAVDLYTRYTGDAVGIYSIFFVIGGVAGLAGCVFLWRTPEPPMPAPGDSRLLATLMEPFRDKRFRPLIEFMALWNFAVNFGAPFFVVYMLRRLGLSMSWVIGLSVVSQVINVLFFRIWGRIADRFTNKSALTVAGPLFVVIFLLFPLTTLPERYVLTIPLLVLIHVVAGISTAGVGLCAGNVALKAAPQGRATAYLAVNALISGIAATIAPVVAGLLADWFAVKELGITLTWAADYGAGDTGAFSPLSLRGLDFLFVISFFLGLYAIHRLVLVREEGEVGEQIVVQELYAEVRRTAREVTSAVGLRTVVTFPYGLLTKVRRRT